MTALAPDLYRAPEVRLPRLLAGVSGHESTSLAGHDHQFGRLPLGGASGRARPRRLIDVVDRAGLTGRGGAGFPTGRKMRSVATRPGPAVVVANGAEGEPASSKDRVLLTRMPHLVMDGISLAAAAVGARQAFLCVHGGEESLLASLAVAAAEREAAATDPVPIELVGIPDRYPASEQSAIVQYLNAGLGKPTFAPPRPHERGVGGRPTLVNNVETLAQVALIARYGEHWFRGAGVPSAPGTTLVTVSGAVAQPGVYEVELGTPVGQVIMLAGGPAEQLHAILVGGYFGAWLPARVAWEAPLSHAGLRAVGGVMGAGMVFALPVTACGLAETARVVRYLAEESAMQCGPCMFGLPALADALAGLAFHGGRRTALGDISQLIPLIEKRGACRHPDGATQLVRSALATFRAEARWHDERGSCHGVRRTPLLPLPADDERDWGWT